MESDLVQCRSDSEEEFDLSVAEEITVHADVLADLKMELAEQIKEMGLLRKANTKLIQQVTNMESCNSVLEGKYQDSQNSIKLLQAELQRVNSLSQQASANYLRKELKNRTEELFQSHQKAEQMRMCIEQATQILKSCLPSDSNRMQSSMEPPQRHSTPKRGDDSTRDLLNYKDNYKESEHHLSESLKRKADCDVCEHPSQDLDTLSLAELSAFEESSFIDSIKELALDLSLWEDHTQLVKGVFGVPIFLERFISKQMPRNTKFKKLQIAFLRYFHQKHISGTEEITQKKAKIAIATGLNLELFREEEISEALIGTVQITFRYLRRTLKIAKASLSSKYVK